MDPRQRALRGDRGGRARAGGGRPWRGRGQAGVGPFHSQNGRRGFGEHRHNNGRGPAWRDRPVSDTDTQQRHVDAQHQAPSSGDAGGSGRMEIPGYYFDAEKNRYFKILANKNVASSSEYTVGAIKEKQAAEKRRMVGEELRTRDQTERSFTRRSRQDHVYGSFSLLLRDKESNIHPRNPAGWTASRAWETMMKYLRRRSVIKDAGGEYAGTGFTMQSGSISDFQLHPTLNHAIIGRTDGTIRTMSYGPPTKGRQHGTRLEQHHSALISSIHYGNSSPEDGLRVISTTLGYGARPGTVQAHKLFLHTPSPSDPTSRPIPHPPTSEFRLSLRRSSAYTSAIAPRSGGGTIISVGAEGRAAIVEGWEGRASDPVMRFLNVPDGTHVLAQEFGGNGNVNINGCRNGNIYLFDLRETQTHRPTTVGAAGAISHVGTGFFPRAHQAAVCALKTLEGARLVSAGIDGSTHMWDLRNHATPILSFAGQVNSHLMLNFAVDEGQHVIVAPGEDTHIRAWSLRTGALLSQTIAPGPPQGAQGGKPAGRTVVRFQPSFTDSGESDGAVWTASGADLEVWRM
ncbi:WD40-repeat-containing domain protein [Fimicolochytrium jonesii]|uniref:WD40-repeat-containing domain protein n=1 Tax=Fimicolochytrium jonesii TaxID=1396493 RepID=UPI0022FE6EB5|nr:WD40-repeat-containing domain protein [Fimicolochytrium jonesii]KAI8827230.1 WD40-repeat-containing domain protein [Fimicolochytrium jonesii]